MTDNYKISFNTENGTNNLDEIVSKYESASILDESGIDGPLLCSIIVGAAQVASILYDLYKNNKVQKVSLLRPDGSILMNIPITKAIELTQKSNE